VFLNDSGQLITLNLVSLARKRLNIGRMNVKSMLLIKIEEEGIVKGEQQEQQEELPPCKQIFVNKPSLFE
jgi:hypothetical protein